MSKSAAKKIRDDIAARFVYASGWFDSKREIACNKDHSIVREAYAAADLLLEKYDVRLWPRPTEPK
jgi:hypothetical protein